MYYLWREFKIRSKRIFSVSLILFLLATQVNAASVYFIPSSGQKRINETFSVAVRVNTSGGAINAGEGSIVFNSDVLQVVSISKAGSIFTLWATDPQFSNTEGTIDFAGGLPSPGYNGSGGLIITVNFKGKVSNTSSEISLVSGGILANDGEGTNVLAGLGKALFSIIPGGPASPEPSKRPETQSSLVPKMDIKSSTHPDPTKWYSNNDPVFEWKNSKEIGENRLVLSRREGTIPIVSYKPAIETRTLEDLEDGIWFLNGRYVDDGSLGPISSFKIQIDTVAPEDFTITRKDTSDPTNPRPEILFKSNDMLSSIEKYEIRIGDGGWSLVDPSDAGETYILPLQSYGSRSVEARAFDRAGNAKSANLIINIEPIEAPVIEEVIKESERGDVLTVKGSSLPNVRVVVLLREDNQSVFLPQVFAKEGDRSYETTSDQSGKWSLRITDLPPGDYSVYAQSKDSRDAVSMESIESIKTVVEGGFTYSIVNSFNNVIDLIGRQLLIASLIVVLVVLVIRLVRIIIASRKLRIVRPKSKKSAPTDKEVKKSIDKVHSMLDDVRSELSFLDAISHRRKLDTGEKYLKSKLEQYQKTLKAVHDQFISKNRKEKRKIKDENHPR